MPRKASGEEKVSIVHSKQKNGDTYVIEKHYVYDPDIGNIGHVTTKLIGKIPRGETEMVDTRAKRPDGAKAAEKSAKMTQKGSVDEVIASRNHVGMLKIIDYIGKSSGIDDALYASTDKGTAQKIISIARYLLATEGSTLPRLESWQVNHPLPYEYAITKDVYHDLFDQVGKDETLQQKFFLQRCSKLPQGCSIAYDSTTISTYSDQQVDARYGYNKDGDNLKTVKLLILYAIDTHQPIAFTKRPGNMADVSSVINGLSELKVLNLNVAEIVMDNAYYSDENLGELLTQHFGFIVRVKDNLTWVKPQILMHMEEFDHQSAISQDYPEVRGFTVPLTRTFTRVRKKGSSKTGAKAGDIETFDKKIYLHLFRDMRRKFTEDTLFNRDLAELKKNLEGGMPLADLPKDLQEKAKKFLRITSRGSKVTVTYNESACQDACRFNGITALISNKEKQCFNCLNKYRNREWIEGFFQFDKQRSDGARPRVWTADVLRGRMFVQFVELCYYEYYKQEINKLRATLQEDIGSNSLTKETLKMEKKLKQWLESTSLIRQLQWFESVEEVDVRTPVYRDRHSSTITERDKMFLEKLGMLDEFPH